MRRWPRREHAGSGGGLGLELGERAPEENCESCGMSAGGSGASPARGSGRAAPPLAQRIQIEAVEPAVLAEDLTAVDSDTSEKVSRSDWRLYGNVPS